MNRNILALDLAARTGWAFGYAEDLPEFGFWDLPEGNAGPAYRALERHVLRLHENYPFNAVVYEEPYPARSKSQWRTVERLHGYKHILELITSRFYIPCVPAPISSWRKAFLGYVPEKARAKSAVLARCGESGLDVEDHNAAEAVGVWFWAHVHKWPSLNVSINKQRALEGVA